MFFFSYFCCCYCSWILYIVRWLKCAQGRAAWLERGRRCSLSENAASCHRRWVKRNRVRQEEKQNKTPFAFPQILYNIYSIYSQAQSNKNQKLCHTKTLHCTLYSFRRLFSFALYLYIYLFPSLSSFFSLLLLLQYFLFVSNVFSFRFPFCYRYILLFIAFWYRF